ncbi:MAG: flagellar motor protein MotB [Bryobacteraceae bacterium]
MADESNAAPIIIKRKKVGHGHHGGAWKVAYADFVTAMMALFIVLWLLSTSEQTQKAVGGYFRDPEGKGKQIGSGLAGVGESLSINKNDLSKLKEKLDEAIRSAPELDKIKEQVKITITGEGLRIELLETAAGIFFESGNPKPSLSCIDVLTKLAAELGKMPNTIVMEGHTDANPMGESLDYTNWELSSDRANAARRVMQVHGLRPDQIVQVRGFAAQQPFKKEDPKDPSNRRITIIVQYQRPPGAEEKNEAQKPEHQSEKKSAHH